MRKEAHALVDAVRALGLALTGKPAPRCITVGIPAAEFSVGLARVQEALEALDRSGAASEDPEVVENMRKGIDGVFKWVRLQGLDTAEPLQILADALAGRASRRPAKYEMLPKLTPFSRRKSNWKPKLHLGSELGGRAMSSFDRDAHAAYGREMAQAADKLGAVMPRRAPEPVPEELAHVALAGP